MQIPPNNISCKILKSKLFWHPLGNSRCSFTPAVDLLGVLVFFSSPFNIFCFPGCDLSPELRRSCSPAAPAFLPGSQADAAHRHLGCHSRNKPGGRGAPGRASKELSLWSKLLNDAACAGERDFSLMLLTWRQTRAAHGLSFVRRWPRAGTWSSSGGTELGQPREREAPVGEVCCHHQKAREQKKEKGY